MRSRINGFIHGPLSRYVNLQVAHAPGMPGLRSQHVTHVPWCIMPWSLTSGLLRGRWRGKGSRHSRRMRKSQFSLSGKRPMENIFRMYNIIKYIVINEMEIGFVTDYGGVFKHAINDQSTLTDPTVLSRWINLLFSFIKRLPNDIKIWYNVYDKSSQWHMILVIKCDSGDQFQTIFMNMLLRENHLASVVWNWYHWVAIAYLYQPSP